MPSKIDLDFEVVIDYMLNNECGYRQASKHFNVSLGWLSKNMNDYLGKKKALVDELLNNNIKKGYSNVGKTKKEREENKNDRN